MKTGRACGNARATTRFVGFDSFIALLGGTGDHETPLSRKKRLAS
jgi:hypothetical protein